MSDEIAAFLLDKSPVDEETLSLVTNHVSSSTGRSSCMLEKVPLYFVFGPDQSMPKFLQVRVQSLEMDIFKNGYAGEHLSVPEHFPSVLNGFIL